jgi:hypothetical protein
MSGAERFVRDKILWRKQGETVITTSNFAKSAKHPDAVAISQGVPRFYRGKRYMPLAPPRWLLKAKDPALFDREYRKLLESLDAKQVAEDLGPNAILLCWESFNVRCHRRLVAEWLEEKLGIVVPELGHERAESVPFSEQPSKWDGKPKSMTQLPMTF